jgi:hypothetical protein
MGIGRICSVGRHWEHGPEEFGTSAQAKAMIQRAIEALQANEGDAIKAFNDKNNNQFHVLDLYVFCINLADGKFTSQLDQSLVGTSAESLRYGQDQYGKRLLSTLREAPEGKVISVAYNALRHEIGGRAQSVLCGSYRKTRLRRRVLQAATTALLTSAGFLR